MRQLLRRDRPKLRERIAEGQMGDELEELVRGRPSLPDFR